jgi:excisionase family DNA binding protein
VTARDGAVVQKVSGRDNDVRPVGAAPPTNENKPDTRERLERTAFEAFNAFVLAFQNLVGVETHPLRAAASDVMTADEAAAFLGVDRNTVYEYAARGVLPHQRLGKRVLFGRGALTAWLDASPYQPARR